MVHIDGLPAHLRLCNIAGDRASTDFAQPVSPDFQSRRRHVFNASSESTLDGRKVAQAYAAELAEVPGFVVIPVSQVETTMRIYGLHLEKEEDARRLAQILEVDAVAVGVVTEYRPYYPPRLTMQVQWFTANPNFHPIPAGYGLPWGTAGEKDIPGPLVFQAELALAKEQLKTQTPPFEKLPSNSPPSAGPGGEGSVQIAIGRFRPADSRHAVGRQHDVRTVSHEAADSAPPANLQAPAAATAPLTLTPGENGPDLPPNWPDPHGFIPRPPDGAAAARSTQRRAGDATHEALFGR